MPQSRTNDCASCSGLEVVLDDSPGHRAPRTDNPTYRATTAETPAGPICRNDMELVTQGGMYQRGTGSSVQRPKWRASR